MQQTAKRFKVGMIGVGDISALHHQAYQGCAQAEVAAICDIDAQMLAARQQAWGIAKAFRDYRDLLADPEIDIIEVNTPQHLHKHFVLEALAAGKHVACQKPLTVSIRDAQEIIAAEKTSKGRLRVIENFVFYPPHVLAKELLEAGEIGELLTIRIKTGDSMIGSRYVPLKTNIWRLPESEKGMGWTIYDDGYHKLSMAIYLGGAIEAVKAFVGASFRYIDSPSQLIWRYKDRATLGSFDLAISPNLYTHSKYFTVDDRIELVGTRGIISVTQCTGQLCDEAPLILYRDGRTTRFEDLETDWQASFTAGIRDFPLALAEGRDTLISAQRGLDIMRFAFALFISSRLGVEIRPDDVTDDLLQSTLAKEAGHA